LLTQNQCRTIKNYMYDKYKIFLNLESKIIGLFLTKKTKNMKHNTIFTQNTNTCNITQKMQYLFKIKKFKQLHQLHQRQNQLK
jgi:hypothetical protein